MSNLLRPPFPRVFGSTILAAVRSCQTKARLDFVEHWKPRGESVHLVAGKAYAKGLEVARTEFFINGRPEIEAEGAGLAALAREYGTFSCPEDSPKSLERMCGALEFYFDQYPMSRDSAIPIALPSGQRGIEFSFVEPIDLLHPETGDPILYCGRMDEVVEFAGQRFGEDDKTTGQLGPQWCKQWDLRSQFTSYCWGAQQANLPLAGFLIRGVAIRSNKDPKKQYETQQAITYRPQWMIDRWYEQMLRDIKRFIEAWDTGYYDYSLDGACNEYGGCAYREVCLAKDPTPWLEMKFEKRAWDPVTREETLL